MREIISVHVGQGEFVVVFAAIISTAITWVGGAVCKCGQAGRTRTTRERVVLLLTR